MYTKRVRCIITFLLLYIMFISVPVYAMDQGTILSEDEFAGTTEVSDSEISETGTSDIDTNEAADKTGEPDDEEEKVLNTEETVSGGSVEIDNNTDPEASFLKDTFQGPSTALNSFANVTDTFSAHIVTSYGVVKSYFTGGIYYLFVPNGYSLNALTIQYSGVVTAVSKGILDTASKTVSGSFSYGDALTFTIADGSTKTVRLMQSSVPSLSIWLNGYTLEDIHSNKDLKAAGTSVTLSDPSNALFNLDVSGAAEFKGRGNSSWNYYNKKG